MPAVGVHCLRLWILTDVNILAGCETFALGENFFVFNYLFVLRGKCSCLKILISC